MKLIVANISVEQLDAVRNALSDVETGLMLASSAKDMREFITGMYRGREYFEPRPKLRFEVVVLNERRVQEAVEAIASAASTNDPGQFINTNIFVLPLDDCAPIRRRQPEPRAIAR